MMDPELIGSFLAESQELLDEIEPQIIEFQESQSGVDIEALNSIFRLFHSMKGSAGILGLDQIAGVTHEAESLLDLFRKGVSEMQAAHADLLLRTLDLLRQLLEQVENNGTSEGAEGQGLEIAAELKAAAKQLVSGSQPEEQVAAKADVVPDDGDGALFILPDDDDDDAEAPAENPASPPVEASASEGNPAVQEGPEFVINDAMRNSFAHEAEDQLEKVETALLEISKDPEASKVAGAKEAFRAMHSLKGNAGFMGLSELERVAHCFETALEKIKDEEIEATEARLTTLLELIDVLREASLGLATGGDGSVESVEALEQRIESVITETAVPIPKPAKPKVAAPKSTRAEPKAAAQNIRVNLEKLDALINLVGELVIAEAMVTRHPHVVSTEIESLDRAVHHLRRVSRELQDVAMSVRMIPLAGTFRKIIRLVHDLGRKSGKSIDLELIGEETEVDKTVIEMISDPLVHIVRNSADHGIEPASERVAAGKPETGTITIEGRHEGGEVWIIIRDDGRGLCREKILAKAIERGLVDEAQGNELEDDQVFKLIFEPGISTAAKITDISGRGVGMDVVKKNLEKLKGKIDVNSQPGVGTTLILRIPLTLAIIDGMLVRVGDARYTIPMLSIRESFRPEEHQITLTPDGQEIVRVREEFFPVLRLHERFGRQPDSEELKDGILVLIENDGRGIAMLVDEILGQQETVIKGLSDFLGDSGGVSGCTILGDGEVSLILDVMHLMEDQAVVGVN
ncbi:MAG: chemotaxis protein CheA [Planctomycetota bacterium]|nr:MAG: chemotaxis protein CheA [Planctomycetota bacterium]